MYYFGKGWAKAVPYLGMLPALLLFSLFVIFPSSMTALLSLTDISGVPGTEWNVIGFDNYVEFFTSPSARDNFESLQRTLIFCAAVTIIQNVIALLLAIILNNRIKGHLFFRSLFFMPVILGVTVTGLMWSLVLNPIDGPAQKLLNAFGTESAFLSSNELAFPLVIFIQIWMSMGYSMVIFLAGLQTIPSELSEAAVIDGANAWQRFRFVIYPLLATSVTTNVLLAIIGSLQTYQIVYVLTNGQFNTTVLSFQIFQQAFSAGTGGTLRQGFASALSMIQFFLVLAITLMFQSYLRRREVQL